MDELERAARLRAVADAYERWVREHADDDGVGPAPERVDGAEWNVEWTASAEAQREAQARMDDAFSAPVLPAPPDA